jgi:hypothetical protein
VGFINNARIDVGVSQLSRYEEKSLDQHVTEVIAPTVIDE